MDGISIVQPADDVQSNILSLLQKTGIPVSMMSDQKMLIQFLLQQYELLNNKYKDLDEQLHKLCYSAKEANKDTSDRIDRILSLMNSNMAYIKQMIELTSFNCEKLDTQDKINLKRETQINTIVDRQNRFSNSLVQVNNNTKVILNEISDLQGKVAKNDAFRTKFTSLTVLGVAILSWLLAGDHLAWVLHFLSRMVGMK